jgi:hypothetical protein
MKTIFITILISVLLSGCQFSKSVKKDLLSGLSSSGNALTCNDVYISKGEERTVNNTFIFGEIFFLNYNNIQGFTMEDGIVFPGMEILVTSEEGDTMLYAKDLYADNIKGFNFSPLRLISDITVATPMRSGNEYLLHSRIWDKKGSGTYSSDFKFNVIQNEDIHVEESGVTFNEAYVYSQGYEKVITDGKIKSGDNIYFIVEGLHGFIAENGLVFPGLKLMAADAKGELVLNYPDFFSEYDQSGISSFDFSSQVSCHFKINSGEINPPLHFEMTIWDKGSEAKIIFTTDLNVE